MLSDDLRSQLERVPPSVDFGIKPEHELWPCRVTLQEGSVRDCIYVQEATAWAPIWLGEDLLPSDWMSIGEVRSIEQSPKRLPPAIANRIYQPGETGMGYFVFTLVFDDGREVPCLTGNAVDFVDLPEELDPARVVDVRLGYPLDLAYEEYRGDGNFIWCFYSDDPEREFRPLLPERSEFRDGV